jgi:hypothetical protein
MADSTFTVNDPRAPRLAVAPEIKNIAEAIAADAAANTPRLTGRMAGAYVVVQGDDPATSLVENPTPYARFVEYGSRYDTAQAPLGRAVAKARSAVR